MPMPEDTTPTLSAAPRPSSSGPKPPATAPATGGGSGAAPHPPGHAIRRSRTETSPLRRRPPMSGITTEGSFDTLPRRSSNFSDYSLSDARDILNPLPQGKSLSHEDSTLPSLSLAFALLPALAGVFFTNGNAIVTDVMLLGLAGIFLHWSVTQPWAWYHSAQSVRIEQEASSEAIEEDSDIESPAPVRDSSSPLDDVPEEEETQLPQKRERRRRGEATQQQAALNELYAYEILSLVSCFLLPLMGAYLLHAIRSQLSRPSEGLVSNYNLTIFLLVSELRVFSHMIKLVQSRTLHLQRVVHSNPFGSTSAGLSLDEMRRRLDKLESRSGIDENLGQQQGTPESDKAKQEAAVTRGVRNAIQPEVDALNRAVRRYEKKATLLQFQTESRFSSVDARLEDAIALAAAAAKNSTSSRSTVAWAMEYVMAMVLFPFKAVLQLLLLPLTSVMGLISRNKQNAPTNKTPRTSRAGKSPAQARYSGDRPPARVMKR